MALEKSWSVQKLYFVVDALLITGHKIKSKLPNLFGAQTPHLSFKRVG